MAISMLCLSPFSCWFCKNYMKPVPWLTFALLLLPGAGQIS